MKKVLKITGIMLLLLIILFIFLVGSLMIKNHITSRNTWVEDDYYVDFQSNAALEKKYAGLGNYDVSNIVISVENDIVENIRIWFPSELENETNKYPLIMVTNASNMAALNYEAFFKRLASWGFIVVGNDDRQAGTGLSTSKTLDYILALNNNSNSLLFAKIAQEDIGIVGYSQGGAGAIRAVTEYENRNQYKTIFTGSAAYSLLAENMGWEYDISKIAIPYFMTAGTGNTDDNGKYSENDFAGVAPLFSLVDNYNGISDNVFKVRARVVGAEHEDMMKKTDGYMTAWMLYQLQNDVEASKVFIGSEAEILNNVNWQDIEKND